MNKILKAFLWILASIGLFAIIVVIIVYSYFRLVIVPKLAVDGIDESQVISFTELAKDLSDKQVIENILNLNKESAVDMLAILDELNSELNAQTTSDGENGNKSEKDSKSDTMTEKEQDIPAETNKNTVNKDEIDSEKKETTKDNGDKSVNKHTQENISESSVSWENMTRSVNQLAQNYGNENNFNNPVDNGATENVDNSENPDNSNQQISKENTTAYQRIMGEASSDEISQGLAIISKVDVSKVNQLRSQGKTAEAKAYIKSVLTPGEISSALNLYNKYKHLL